MESLSNLDTVSTKFNDFVFVRIQVINQVRYFKNLYANSKTLSLSDIEKN